MDDIRKVNVRGTQYSIASASDISLAPIEAGTTASQAYSEGNLLIFSGRLCKATTSISQGATLAVGTNLEYDTIADEVESINVSLSDFSFRNNQGQAQYSMDGGDNWQDFKHPVGTKSITANGTHDVTDYASVNVAVPHNAVLSGSSPQNYWYYTTDGTNRQVNSLAVDSGTSSTMFGTCSTYTGPASMTRSEDTLTITIPQTIRCGFRGGTQTEGSYYDYSRPITVTVNLS